MQTAYFLSTLANSIPPKCSPANCMPFLTQLLWGLLLISFSSEGFAQAQGVFCQMALNDIPMEDKIISIQTTGLRTVENPQLLRLFDNQKEFGANDELQKFMTKPPRQQYEEAKRILEHHRVVFSEGADQRLWGLIKKNILIISPIADGAPLNRLAYSLHKTMGVSLTYNPHRLAYGSAAYFTSATNEIGIPHNVALSGKPDISLFHEIRHASLDSKLKKDQPSLFEAEAVLADKDIPVHHSYDNYLSFQEIETYFQDAKYAYLVSRNTQIEGLPSKVQRQFLNKVADTIRLSLGVYSIAGRRLHHAYQLLSHGGGKVQVKRLSDRILLFELKDRTYNYDFKIKDSETPRKGKERDYLLSHVNSMITEKDRRKLKLENMHTEINARLITFLKQ